MKNYFKSWDLMRVFRLAMGIFVIVQGVRGGHWALVILGLAVSMMPLWNIGCCGTTGCQVPASKKERDVEDISYEEVR